MKIQEWFDSEQRDYGIGLAILGNYCKNRVLLQNLSRKENLGKLEYELKKALDREDAKPGKIKKLKSKPEPTTEKKVHPLKGTSRALNVNFDKLIIVRNNRKVNFEDLPVDIQILWSQNRDAYKEIRATHEKLKLMEKATPEDRQPLTNRIAELDELIRENWEVIDGWQPGDEPEPATKETVSAEINHKRIGANRKYISVNLKKLAAETDEKKVVKLKAKIEERVNELISAGEKLNDATVEALKIAGISC